MVENGQQGLVTQIHLWGTGMNFKLNGTEIEKRTHGVVWLVMLIMGALYSSSTEWPKLPLAVWRESWLPGGDYFCSQKQPHPHG